MYWKFLNVLFFYCVAAPSCDALHFQCLINITQCIPLPWLCDGGYDCQDHTDELNCSKDSPNCDDNEFHCKISHECIHNSWVCDGDRDCGDASDELQCEIFIMNDFYFKRFYFISLKNLEVEHRAITNSHSYIFGIFVMFLIFVFMYIFSILYH